MTEEFGRTDGPIPLVAPPLDNPFYPPYCPYCRPCLVCGRPYGSAYWVPVPRSVTPVDLGKPI